MIWDCIISELLKCHLRFLFYMPVRQLNHGEVIVSNEQQACAKKSREYRQKPYSRKWKGWKQDGRLAPAYFLPNYKYFDQFLQTVKNKTTVLILVFKEFLQINSTTDFCTFCKRVSRFSLENFRLTVPKNFVEEPFCVSENFCFRKMLGIREGGVSRLSVEIFLSHSAKKFCRGPVSVSIISCIEKY